MRATSGEWGAEGASLMAHQRPRECRHSRRRLLAGTRDRSLARGQARPVSREADKLKKRGSLFFCRRSTPQGNSPAHRRPASSAAVTVSMTIFSPTSHATCGRFDGLRAFSSSVSLKSARRKPIAGATGYETVSKGNAALAVGDLAASSAVSDGGDERRVRRHRRGRPTSSPGSPHPFGCATPCPRPHGDIVGAGRGHY